MATQITLRVATVSAIRRTMGVTGVPDTEVRGNLIPTKVG
jgi:hypothetical protein